MNGRKLAIKVIQHLWWAFTNYDFIHQLFTTFSFVFGLTWTARVLRHDSFPTSSQRHPPWRQSKLQQLSNYRGMFAHGFRPTTFSYPVTNTHLMGCLFKLVKITPNIRDVVKYYKRSSWPRCREASNLYCFILCRWLIRNCLLELASPLLKFRLRRDMISGKSARRRVVPIWKTV